MSNFNNNPQDLDEDFESLLEQHLPKAAPRHKGELVDATVVRLLDDVILLNYGGKEEAPVSASEFMDVKGLISVKPGDSVTVAMVGRDEDGNPKFSYKKAKQEEAVKMLGQAAKAGVPVRGVVSKVVNSGVIVDVGLPAFLPASQADVQRIADLNSLLGQHIEAYVLEYDEEQQRAVLSRKKLLAERLDKDKQAFLETLTPGNTVRGKIREILDFGAFVELGPIQGLLPRSEISYERGTQVGDFFVPGQEAEFKVVEVSRENGRVTLSRKRLGEDPWTRVKENYGVGTNVSGKIVSVQNFGAFVQLEEGVTGLVHIKDVSWDHDKKDADSIFKVGDEVACQVLEIDESNRRLALSVKHLSRDPWLDVTGRFPVGSRHKGVVNKLRDFGAIVKLDDSVEGLLHIGDLSWEKRPAHPSEVVSEGQELEVTILNHDLERRRIGLGLKQLTGSPFEQFTAANPVGSIISGEVSRIESYGAFINLLPGLEGLIHISELDDIRVDSPERVVRLGETVKAKILEVVPSKQRISLSRKEAIRDIEQENIRQYTNTQAEKKAPSAFAAALEAAKNKK